MKKIVFNIILLIVSMGLHSQALQDRAEAIWDFETSSLADSSGNGHSGTTSGTVTVLGTGGILGNYVETDGSGGDYIEISAISTGNAFSIGGWVYLDDVDADHRIVGRYYGDFEIYVNSSDNWAYTVFGNYLSSSTTAATGEWVHIMLTYDNSLGSDNVKFYVNGTSVSTHNVTTAETHSTANWQFMANGNDSYSLDGRLDAWALFKETLDATTISDTLYKSGSPTYSYLWTTTTSSDTTTIYNFISIDGTNYNIYKNSTYYAIAKDYIRYYGEGGGGDPPPVPPDTTYAEGTAESINALIGKGLDLRNIVLDGDGNWNMNQTYKDSAYIYSIAQKGFESVRLVMKTGLTTRTLPEAALDNACEIIDSCINNGLFVIFDYHVSPDWWHEDYYSQTDADSLAAHWGQMAEYFESKYTNEQMAFELANEPRDEGANYWNTTWHRCLDSIRVYDQSRLICVEPIDWGQISGIRNFEPHPTDTMWALTIHYYDPWWVTVQNSPYEGSFGGTDYAGAEFPKIEPVYDIFEEDWEDALDFRSQHDVPLNITEWGTMVFVDSANRVDYSTMLSAWLADNNIPWTYWDHRTDFGAYMNPDYGSATTSGWYEPLATNLINDSYPSLDNNDTTTIYEYNTWAAVGQWDLDVYGTTADASVAVDNGNLKVTINTSDYNMLNIRLNSPSFELTQSDVYKVTYIMKTDGGTKTQVAHKYSGYHSWNYTYNLNTSSTTVVETYIMPRATASGTTVEFLLGYGTQNFILEYFKLEKYTVQ